MLSGGCHLSEVILRSHVVYARWRIYSAASSKMILWIWDCKRIACIRHLVFMRHCLKNQGITLNFLRMETLKSVLGAHENIISMQLPLLNWSFKDWLWYFSSISMLKLNFDDLEFRTWSSNMNICIKSFFNETLVFWEPFGAF